MRALNLAPVCRNKLFFQSALQPADNYKAREKGRNYFPPRGVRNDWNTEKYLRNLLKSNRNQIIFTIFPTDLDPNGRPFWSKSIVKFVNTIWVRDDLIRFRKDLSVCTWVASNIPVADQICFSANAGRNVKTCSLSSTTQTATNWRTGFEKLAFLGFIRAQLSLS